MQAAGNDFIVIEQLTQNIIFKPEWVNLLSCRKTGIGCDQLLLLEPPQNPNTDFFYRIFNADGTEVEQCGNGARCIGQFIVHKKLSHKASWEIETIKSKLLIAVSANNQAIRVNLGIPNFDANSLPFNFTDENIVDNIINDISFKLDIKDEKINYPIEFSIVSMGNPHIVINLDKINIDKNNKNLINNFINKIGRAFNNHPQFPKGVNVNFIDIVDNSNIKLITYERGAGVTQACGTGSCASAVCARKLGLVTENNINIINTGGILTVSWIYEEQKEHPVWLAGPSAITYEGYIDI